MYIRIISHSISKKKYKTIVISTNIVSIFINWLVSYIYILELNCTLNKLIEFQLNIELMHLISWYNFRERLTSFASSSANYVSNVSNLACQKRYYSKNLFDLEYNHSLYFTNEHIMFYTKLQNN